MKIALIGYGRMGHAIERIALSRGHSVCARIDIDNIAHTDSPEFRQADVAIEFSRPDAAPDNILRAFAAGIPVVSGTTGWDSSMPDIRSRCLRGEGTLFHSSNFSIGVFLFRALNRYLTHIMNRFPAYTPSLSETHHIHKLDHPSGTAITLARDMEEASSRITGWKEPDGQQPLDEGILPVFHERRGEVPGIHSVTWKSDVDSIRITHSAESRDGFALGAVIAAEWLCGRHGFFTMDDMITL